MGAERVPVTTGTRPERAGTTRGPGLLVAEGEVSQWISTTRTSATARYGAGTSTGTPIATSRAALGMGVASVYRAVQRMARTEQQSFLEGELSDAELSAVAARYGLADVDLTDRGNIATLRDLAAGPTNALALRRV
jgi:hypothetical protein